MIRACINIIIINILSIYYFLCIITNQTEPAVKSCKLVKHRRTLNLGGGGGDFIFILKITMLESMSDIQTHSNRSKTKTFVLRKAQENF